MKDRSVITVFSIFILIIILCQTIPIIGFSGSADASIVKQQWIGIQSTIARSMQQGSPGVRIVATPTSGSSPLTVNFTAVIYNSISIINVTWNFGDGNANITTIHGIMPQASNGANIYTPNPSITHIFIDPSAALPVIREVIVDVTNVSNGAVLTGYTNITINPTNFNVQLFSNVTGGEPPLFVQFSSIASGGLKPYIYKWNFGDGATLNTQSTVPPVHVYTKPGIDPVTVTAQYTIPGTSIVESTSKTITINVGSTYNFNVSIIADPTTPVINEPVNFIGIVRGGYAPFTYSWDFGNGKGSPSDIAQTTYTTTGNFIVTLTVVDNSGTSMTVTKNINVVPSANTALAGVVNTTSTSGEAPFEETFYIMATNGTDSQQYFSNMYVTVSFGDGTPNFYGPLNSTYGYVIVNHVYESSKGFGTSYAPTITITNNTNTSPYKITLTNIQSIIVQNDKMTVSLSSSHLNFQPPESILFNLMIYNVYAESYNVVWSINPGNIQFKNIISNSSTTVMYNLTASNTSYNITVTVFDGSITKSTTLPIVSSSYSLNLSYYVTPAKGTLPLTIYFGAVFSGGAYNGTPSYTYGWYLNGMFVSGLSGSYTINTKGLFTYSVYVKDSDGIFQNISGTADVTGYPLSVTLLATPSAGISPLAVNISAFASGGVPSYSYSWSFGNGTTPVSSGSLSYINYTFNTPGIYNVSVTVTDSTHKTTVNSTYVYVYAPPPSGLSTIDITGIVGTIILVAFAMYWYIFIFRKKKRKGKFKSYLEGNETSPYEFPNYNTYNPPKKKNPFSKLGNLIHKKGKNNVVKEEQYNNPPPYNGYHGPQQYGQGYRQNVNNYPENNLEQNQYSEKTIPYLQENRENETRNPPVISLRKKRER